MVYIVKSFKRSKNLRQILFSFPCYLVVNFPILSCREYSLPLEQFCPGLKMLFSFANKKFLPPGTQGVPSYIANRTAQGVPSYIWYRTAQGVPFYIGYRTAQGVPS